MKKHSFLLPLLGLMLAATASVTLTGCDDDGYWPYYPPAGWGSNYFYDSRLIGDWELTTSSIAPVGPGDVNYMEFYGGGHGRYYYYTGGRLESEEMAYFCQEADGPGSGRYQINVQYEDGNSSTMYYALSNGDNSLMLRWRAGGGTETYVYSRVRVIPM